ncbi:hypothetical protein TNCV_332791 [Trichonephila clavipes]|nr:hypothetical protein TNCV_332791 [Trichonephila clavipes]
MVTVNEKWVTYYSIVQKQSWSKCDEAAQTEAKPGLGQEDLYCQQVDSLKLAIDQKWPKLPHRRCVVFQQDNVRLHSSVMTPPETLGDWLGSFNAFTIQSQPGTKRLSPFSRIVKLPE